MDFDQLQDALNAALVWQEDPKFSFGGNFRQVRAFILPEEWEGAFYGECLVWAFAHTFPFKREEDPSQQYLARVVVCSGRATSIEIEGPWEDFDKAKRRLQRIIGSMDMTRLPPTLDEIQQIAQAHGMWATRQ